MPLASDAGANPHHSVLGDADLCRDLVGRLEADAADVTRQAVWVLADDRDGLGTIGLVDPHRPAGADAMGVQEQHDLAYDLLLGPAGGDAFCALGADALDLAQAPAQPRSRQTQLAESLHQALGIGWSDAADHARAQ